MFHINPAINNAHSKLSDFVVDEDHEYTTPSKCVKTPQDMQLWEKSEAYFEYLGFILAINEAVKGKSLSLPGVEISHTIKKLILLLEKVGNMVDTVPPIEQPQRFGNQAFRTWYQKLKDLAFDLLKEVLASYLHRAIPEIMMYLIEGFGNSTRIDYGTGHEISFLMFLCCLFKVGALVEEDKTPVACKVFPKYLEVVRKLQQTYRMEPAGSHGVWSLDDYQFVPFIWGSSQLIGHPKIEPLMFLQPEIVSAYYLDYMFLSCIRYINMVKKGPFAEHSNQLWGISGVASWSKINGGLVKMYKVEVLGKFPVVQHIVFGSLFPIKPAEANSSLRKARMTLTPPSSINLLAGASTLSSRTSTAMKSDATKSDTAENDRTENYGTETNATENYGTETNATESNAAEMIVTETNEAEEANVTETNATVSNAAETDVTVSNTAETDAIVSNAAETSATESNAGDTNATITELGSPE